MATKKETGLNGPKKSWAVRVRVCGACANAFCRKPADVLRMPI